MKGFDSYLRRSAQGKEALRQSFRIIGRNQTTRTPQDNEALIRGVSASFVAGELNDITNRHLGPDAISSALGLNTRSRR